MNRIKPLITVSGSGRGSRLSICGIDISRAISNFEYGSHSPIVKDSLNGRLKVDIDICILLGILKDLTDGEIVSAKEVLKPYITRE